MGRRLSCRNKVIIIQDERTAKSFMVEGLAEENRKDLNAEMDLLIEQVDKFSNSICCDLGART